MSDPNSSSPRGVLFSRVYMRPAELASDSKRMRMRLAALINSVSDSRRQSIEDLIERVLGVEVSFYTSSGTREWWLKAQLRDFLDAITISANTWEGRAHQQFVSEVRNILDEDAVHYSIDDSGGVHPRVDALFEEQTAATLAGLAGC